MKITTFRIGNVFRFKSEDGHDVTVTVVDIFIRVDLLGDIVATVVYNGERSSLKRQQYSCLAAQFLTMINEESK